MKRHLVVLSTLLLVLAAPLQACDDVEEQAYLLDEILRLSYEGVPDRIIIKQMHTMDFVFCLSASDIIELRSLGVSDAVLEAIIETSLVEEEERRRETPVVVRVSPGYWSPWYRYPIGWGFYYDPFPRWYSYHYYPFLYACDWAWYGWYPNTYYYTYNWYNVACDYTPHDADYREEAGLHLAGNRPAQVVARPPSAIPPAGIPATTARPVASQRDNGRAGLNDAVSRQDLTVRRTPYRSAEVTSPPVPTRTTVQERLPSSVRSQDLNVRTRSATSPTPPASRPVDRAAETVTQPPARVTPQPERKAPERVTRPPARESRPVESTRPRLQPRRSEPVAPPSSVRSRPTTRLRSSTSVTPPSTQRRQAAQSFVPGRTIIPSTPRTTSPRLSPPAPRTTMPRIQRPAPAPRPTPAARAKPPATRSRSR